MKIALSIVLLASALVSAERFRYDEIEMLCLVNKQRVRYGLHALAKHPALTHAAQYHSDEQARTNTMTHSDRRGRSLGQRVEQAGYRNWKSVGENVAFGYKDEIACMDAWMRSPGHRANILNGGFTHMGSALAWSGETPYYTQEFAGDGERHNFPICPGRSDNSHENEDYSGHESPRSHDNYDDSAERDYVPQHHVNYTPDNSHVGHRGNRIRKCKKKQHYKTVVNDYEQLSYGGHDNYGDDQPSYGGEIPEHHDQPAYGGHDNYGDDQPSYGGEMPEHHDQPTHKKPCKKNQAHNIQSTYN